MLLILASNCERKQIPFTVLKPQSKILTFAKTCTAVFITISPSYQLSPRWSRFSPNTEALSSCFEIVLPPATQSTVATLRWNDNDKINDDCDKISCWQKIVYPQIRRLQPSGIVPESFLLSVLMLLDDSVSKSFSCLTSTTICCILVFCSINSVTWTMSVENFEQEKISEKWGFKLPPNWSLWITPSGCPPRQIPA